MWLNFKAPRDCSIFAGNIYRRPLMIEDGVSLPNSARDINLANALSIISSGRVETLPPGEMELIDLVLWHL
jgi:hypothetical protein